jgi:hypothetical protein
METPINAAIVLMMMAATGFTYAKCVELLKQS